MKKSQKITIFIIFFLHIFTTQAQQLQIGDGTYNGSNIIGPMNTTSFTDTAFNRHAWIFPSATLNGLIHGDTINAIEFLSEGFASIVGNPNFKIYMKMSAVDSFPSGSLNWLNESQSTGMKLVYNNDPTSEINNLPGFKNFVFNQNGNFFKFDTTGKKFHLEVLVEYTQTKKQNEQINWTYESSFSVVGYKSNNESKYIVGNGLPTNITNRSDSRKPTIIFHFPRYSNNLYIKKVYSLGKIPVLAKLKDTVRVLIVNDGKQTQTNKKVYLSYLGKKNYKDSSILTSIKPYESKFVLFHSYKVDSLGKETLYANLQDDEYNTDNTDSTERLINYNVFSQTNPYKGNNGGIGFNGETGDFVAKFFCDTGLYINQITVDFGSTGRSFQLGIWDDNGKGGLPGTELFMSSTLTTKPGNYILPISPRIKVGGGYYVGLRQTSNTNIAFTFQFEDPIRPYTFFFTSPASSNNWVGFSPGFPFNFNIQPRIQVKNDVGATAIVYPTNDQIIQYKRKDSIAPSASFTNFGINDQNTAFNVKCVIRNSAGTLLYESIKQITLKSEETKTVVFDKKFYLYNLGTHRVSYTSYLDSDSIPDNNEITSQFQIIVNVDIGVDLIYSPSENQVYEYKKDSIIPTYRIQNFGNSTQNNIPVFIKIYNSSNQLVYKDSVFQNMNLLSQKILTFKKIIPNWLGQSTMYIFTSRIDTIPFNDTTKVTFMVKKSNDVGPYEFLIPSANTEWPKSTLINIRTNIFNYGEIQQDSTFLVRYWIKNANKNILYYDSIFINGGLGAYSYNPYQFKKFRTPDTPGIYYMYCQTYLNTDQESSNDTLSRPFKIIYTYDATISQILMPKADTILRLGTSGFQPQFVLKNVGSSTLNYPAKVYSKIEFNNQVVYLDSQFITTNLARAAEKNYFTSKVFSPIENGIYTISCYAKYPQEEYFKNDTLTSKFNVLLSYDLALDSFSNIKNIKYDFKDANIIPKLHWKNNGFFTYDTTAKIVIQIWRNNQLFETETHEFDSVMAKDILTISFDNDIYLKNNGTYQLKAFFSTNKDQNRLNDTLNLDFSVYKSFDLQIDSIVSPYNNAKWTKYLAYKPKLWVSNQSDSDTAIDGTIVFRLMNNNLIIKEYSQIINFSKNEYNKLVFDSTCIPNFIGIGKVYAFVYNEKDVNRSNDTIWHQIEVLQNASIKHINPLQIQCIPNPSKGQFKIQSNPIRNFDFYEIYNHLGIKVIDKGLIENNEININVPAGLYQIVLREHDNSYSTRILIIK